MASISILVLMTARRLDRRAGQSGIGEVRAEHLVVAAEVARVLKVGRDAHHVVERRAVLGEDARDRVDRRLRLHLDRAVDHVAVGVLGDLAGDEDEVAGAHRRMERQVRDSSCRSRSAGPARPRPPRKRRSCSCAALPSQHARLDDVDAVDPVDEIDEAAIVHGHVVGRCHIRARRRVRQVMADLARREGIGDVDEPQPLREPGEGDDRAA